MTGRKIKKDAAIKFLPNSVDSLRILTKEIEVLYENAVARPGGIPAQNALFPRGLCYTVRTVRLQEERNAELPD